MLGVPYSRAKATRSSGMPAAGYAAIGGQLGNAVVLWQKRQEKIAAAACGKECACRAKNGRRLFFPWVEAHGGERHIAHQRNHAPVTVDRTPQGPFRPV